MAPRYTYSLEFLLDGKWFCPAGMQDGQRSFLVGYMMGRADSPPPRLGMRVVRSDGKVVDEYKPSLSVGVGMVAGWPTPEQYEAAAEDALKTAARIREAKHQGLRPE